MAIKQMTKVGVDGEVQELAWEYQQDLSSVTAGDSIIIPDGINGISVTVSFTDSAEGKVQTSTDTLNVIQNGTPTWVDWTLGTVSATTQDWSRPVTAIRANQTSIGGGSGTMKMSVRAQ